MAVFACHDPRDRWIIRKINIMLHRPWASLHRGIRRNILKTRDMGIKLYVWPPGPDPPPQTTTTTTTTHTPAPTPPPPLPNSQNHPYPQTHLYPLIQQRFSHKTHKWLFITLHVSAGFSVACSTASPVWQQRKHKNSILLALYEGNPLVIFGFCGVTTAGCDSILWRIHVWSVYYLPRLFIWS